MTLHEKIALTVLATLCVCMGLITHPPILGGWEGSVVYHVFAPSSIGLDFRIHPRANIGGYQYAFLDMTRFFTDFFGLTLAKLRFLPVVYGIAAVFLFFAVAKRWLGLWPALFTAALLATNRVFLVFQHEAIILVLTFACVLFCIERFQKADAPDAKPIALATFGLACAFTALHYGIGRYLMATILAFWFFSFHSSKECSKRVKLGVWIALGFLVTLEVLNLRNILLLNGWRFFSPPSSENAESKVQILESIPFNLPIVWGAFWGNLRHFSEHSTDVIIDVRSKFLSFPAAVLFFIGLGLSFFRFRKEKSKRTLWFWYMLAFLTLIPPALSIITMRETGEWVSTISIYRLFFALIPIHLFIGYAFKAGFEKKRFPVAVAAALLVIAQVGLHIAEVRRFAALVRDYDCGIVQKTREFRCGKVDEIRTAFGNYDANLQKYNEHILYNNHIAYYRFAQQIKLRLNALKTIDADHPVVLNIDSWPLDEKPYISHFIPYNYFPFFLSLYLSDAGVKNAYVQLFLKPPQPNPRERLMPAQYDHEKRVYRNPTGVQKDFILRGNGNVFLATNAEERTFLLNTLAAQRKQPQTVEMF